MYKWCPGSQRELWVSCDVVSPKVRKVNLNIVKPNIWWFIVIMEICILFPCRKHYFSFFITKLASDWRKLYLGGVLFRRHFKILKQKQTMKNNELLILALSKPYGETFFQHYNKWESCFTPKKQYLLLHRWIRLRSRLVLTGLFRYIIFLSQKSVQLQHLLKELPTE